ncbi:RDD family protein [Marivivens donghaensis]|uniref:RDD family protein n=1 Tax=Marivivens donghaensis TaxID=1699413 RepID=A0ABX0VYF4_9RHOB|nr:RDD family protein [Marivivens donghaensis]NIY73100.1 RDD family protein [Marivivens donghaensis]
MTSTDFYYDGLPDPDTRPEFYKSVRTKRAFAWLIDITIIGLAAVIITPLTAFTALFFFPAFSLVVGFVYRWWTLSNKSATWGMRMMSVEIRRNDGAPLDSGTAFMHTLGLYVSFGVAPLQLISILMMLVSQRKQGLTDLILGTAAINRSL